MIFVIDDILKMIMIYIQYEIKMKIWPFLMTMGGLLPSWFLCYRLPLDVIIGKAFNDYIISLPRGITGDLTTPPW